LRPGRTCATSASGPSADSSLRIWPLQPSNGDRRAGNGAESCRRLFRGFSSRSGPGRGAVSFYFEPAPRGPAAQAHPRSVGWALDRARPRRAPGTLPQPTPLPPERQEEKWQRSPGLPWAPSSPTESLRGGESSRPAKAFWGAGGAGPCFPEAATRALDQGDCRIVRSKRGRASAALAIRRKGNPSGRLWLLRHPS